MIEEAKVIAMVVALLLAAAEAKNSSPQKGKRKDLLPLLPLLLLDFNGERCV